DAAASAATLSFFFQAEDGIRDRNVTGVQTCALPISPGVHRATELAGERPPPTRIESVRSPAEVGIVQDAFAPHPGELCHPRTDRSEERRVGKGRRSRAGPGAEDDHGRTPARHTAPRR